MKYIFLSLFVLLISCDNQSQPSQMEVAHLYIDILVAEETNKGEVELISVAVDSLYKKYGISESEYTNALANYKFDEDTWNKFFDLAEEYLDTLKAIESRKGK